MSLRRALLFMMAVAFGSALTLYVMLHGAWQKTFSSGPLATAGECTDENAIEEKKNPNKLLFISCGGFLE